MPAKKTGGSSSSGNVSEITNGNIAPDSANDPENSDFPGMNGTEIKADHLEKKTGKANGVDVSKWQGKIDWKTVKKSGIDFAIIRIGYRAENGKIYKDEYADYNIQQADKAGLLIGVYFFSTAVNEQEAREEASWTVKAIEAYPISYPVVYDCEGFLNSNSRMYGVSNEARTKNAMSFLGEIKKSGYEAMLYAAKSELEGSRYWDTSKLENTCKIWVAHYPKIVYPQKETPDYDGKYDMWQYTNMGLVNGIQGSTDMIVSYFVNQKASPKSDKAVAPATVPTNTDNLYSPVNEKVTAKNVVNLRESATTKSKIVFSLKNGEIAVRVGMGTNGWSKLEYQGKTVYAITSYLTNDLNYRSDKPSDEKDLYTPVDEQVTAKDVVNLRESATTNSNIVASLKNGEVVKRVGVNVAGGWSKLVYNGKTVYAVSSYLTTDLNYKPDKPDTDSKPHTQDDGFAAVNESVTAKSETNLRTAPNTKSESQVVYTLKNGEYIKRIGINNASGWSKLEYNGKIVYAVSSYLTK